MVPAATQRPAVQEDGLADIDRRRPVWSALSDLFLDTDVSLLREHTAKVLAASPYSIQRLEQVLVDEVYPACRLNLFAWPGGEWAEFDSEWLEARIARRLRSPFRALHWFNLGRLTVHLSWEWRQVKRRVAELRASQPDAEHAG